jgi:hypothetical protein
MTPQAIIQQAIKEYGRPFWVSVVPMTIRQAVAPNEIEDMLVAASTNPEIEKSDEILVQTMIQWCGDHLFEHITHHDLATKLGITPMHARGLINRHPEIYRKLQRGWWEVRDPKSDRTHK